MIKVKSFSRDNNQLVPVEIELTLWPGIPGVQFLGLPDQHLKESSLRIKSAIRAAGFEWPLAQQVLVNLRPSHLKKTSRGLELAVAAAFLWETEQVRRPLECQDFFVYGELSLSGEISEPGDLRELEAGREKIVLTGASFEREGLPFRRQRVSHLQDLGQPQEILAEIPKLKLQRPSKFIQQLFSKEQAEILRILGVGGHSCLLAGAAGSGKSTVGQALGEILTEPGAEEFFEIQKIHQKFGIQLDWRPIVKPHHTTSTVAMVGGGSVPFAGEISRAHGGVLILDELLEFSPKVQEALREPFEDGKMRVFRNGKLREYPAKSQIVATTNLCPCGRWTPQNRSQFYCSWNRLKCENYRQRLSGPLLDRFEILCYMDRMTEAKVSREDIIDDIQASQDFARSQKISMDAAVILKDLSGGLKIVLESEKIHSQRRINSTLRVARTLATLDRDPTIQRSHLQKSISLCMDSFSRLHQG